MSRFELENFKNVLIIDHSILISNTFYQSADHFKYRTKNSKSDIFRSIKDIEEIQFHSIGNILTIKFDDSVNNLKFIDNKSMLEFIQFIKHDDLKPTNNKKNNVTTAIVTSSVPIICLAITLFFILKDFKMPSVLSKGLFLTGLCYAIILIIKKLINSQLITYKKNQ